MNFNKHQLYNYLKCVHIFLGHPVGVDPQTFWQYAAPCLFAGHIWVAANSYTRTFKDEATR